ncbi:glutamate--tRNA ligase, cytoplasmic [Tanacetum coccineum]
MGKVRLRFAPEPSGYLHMGHLKAALLNQDSAQKYHGKQIIRFDDTNPAKKNNEFVYNILNDLETMGINYELIFTSDYFPQLIGIAQKLIEEEKSFIHDTPREQMQSERMARIDSKCRNNTVAENINKQKLLGFVENEMVDGWDDAHFPTVQGMVRRGSSKNLNLMEWDKLWSINKKIIDHVVLDTLQLSKKVKDSDGNVTELNRVLPPEGSVYKTTKLKLTWLLEINELSPPTLLEFGYLLNKNKLSDNEKLIDDVNPNSKKEITAFESGLTTLEKVKAWRDTSAGEKRLFQM